MTIMPIDNIEEKLESLTGNNISNWRETFSERRKNRKRLRHSKQIALDINLYLKKKGLNGTKLAKMLNVSSQQVSKILKGSENLTLETITKIEVALGIDLIYHNSTIPKTKSQPIVIVHEIISKVEHTEKLPLFKTTNRTYNYKYNLEANLSSYNEC